jgi:hypothetical protein
MLPSIYFCDYASFRNKLWKHYNSLVVDQSVPSKTFNPRIVVYCSVEIKKVLRVVK